MHGDGMRDNRNFNGGLQDKNTSEDLLILTDGMLGSFKFDGGMRDEKGKITDYGRSADNCEFNQAESK